MALDLFANYERMQNSSIFYRLTANSPYTVTIRLSDLLNIEADYTSVYYAESSINDGPFEQFQLNGTGTFITSVNWNVATPCVCSITVAVSSDSTKELLDIYTLSGIFLSSLPVADFIAYPTYVVYRDVDNLVKSKTLNSTNFYESSGVFFYGEGHSEIINLSASAKPSEQTLWYVGNNLNSIEEFTSVFEVTAIDNKESLVFIDSVPGQQFEIPISALITDGTIGSSDPIIRYNDTTGQAEFYSYFTSSLNLTGGQNPSNTKFKDSIEVRSYPLFTPSTFQNPFSSETTLPFDYTSIAFLATIQSLSGTNVLDETFDGSKWLLSADSGDTEWSVETDFLQGICGYQFPLGYYTNEVENFLPAFKASSVSPTTVALKLTAQKTIEIDPINGPNDWLPVTINEVRSFSTIVKPIPAAKIYFPNYFVERNTFADFFAIPTVEQPFEIQSITIRSPYSPTIVNMTSNSLSGSMFFDEIGMVDLSATFVINDTSTNTSTTIGTVFQNIIEVVENYDDVDEEFYQTTITPLQLTYTEQPKIVPNEWAIADNVNSIIEKFYQTLEELDRYTKLYELKSKFYGWIGPKLNSSLPTTTIETSVPTYVWQDLECPSPSTSEEASWAQFECLEGNEISSKTWQYHECDEAQSDPTCLQKYCVEWKWRSRKCAESETPISWKDAKCAGKFAKKWKFEPCELANPPLNCDRDNWKISTLDPLFFPIPSCSSKQRCAIADIEHLETTGHLVIAYPTELHLVKNDYYTGLEDNESLADQLFSFQNIVGLTTNSEGKIIILDSILCKVSIYRVVNDNIRLFNTWGQFGLRTTPQGLNQPSDIHIDQQNSLWIADTGNKCVKKFTINGKHLMTITNEQLETNPPKSVCVDSQLNCHVLVEGKVLVFDSTGQYLFEYILPERVVMTSKINTSYNREVVYITYELGVVKYFRTGTIYEYLFHEYKCQSGNFFLGYNSITQDKFRNVYITIGDKILKVPDLMKIVQSKTPLNQSLYWKLEDLLIHKEEYIQPWVYLKSFHRLWDNIELLRNVLFYDVEGCKSFKAPIYSKENLIIGQNELVMNSVINRLSFQLWTNLQKLVEYFDPNCKSLTAVEEIIRPTTSPTTVITSPSTEKGIVTFGNNARIITFGNSLEIFPFD